MRSFLGTCVAVVAIAIAWPQFSHAQWEPQLNGKVPLTASGEPDLDAPPPRTADGKPDLTGVWQGAGGGPSSEEAGSPPVAGFRDVGQNIEGGLPLRPDAAALLDERRARDGADNPEAHCLPMGIMQFHTQGAP